MSWPTPTKQRMEDVRTFASRLQNEAAFLLMDALAALDAANRDYELLERSAKRDANELAELRSVSLENVVGPGNVSPDSIVGKLRQAINFTYGRIAR